VTAVPDANYHFVSWSDGVLTASRTDMNVTADLTATASFALSAAALQFNGSNQYVTFGPAPALGASRFTIELWFKKTGTGVTTSTGTGGVTAVPVLTKGRSEADGSNVDMNYFLGIDATGHLVSDYEEGTGQLSPGLNHPVVGSTVIANNVWYHGAAVYDGSSLRLYLNGVLDGVTTGLAGRAPQSASIQHAGLGTAFNSTGVASGFFAGVTDEPRIWNVARTQCQIVAGMNAEITSGTGLLGRWGLNEASGAVAVNSVGSSPNGTLTNSPTWVVGAPFDLTPPVVPAPTAPSGLTAVALDAVQMQLNWTDTANNEESFQIERGHPPDSPFVSIATVGPNVTSYVDAPLQAQTEYCYQVQAVNCGGSSDAVSACATAQPSTCLALDLNPSGGGTQAYVNLGNPAALQLGNFTLELWVRRDGAGVGTNTGTGGIADAVPLITKGRAEDETAAHDINYFLGIRQGTGVLCADFEEGPGGTSPSLNHPVVGTTVVPIGSWHHVAATYDGSTWKLYLDGNLEAQLAVNQPAASASTVAVALGSALNSTNVASGYFDGAVDEARIWNYARTQGQIQTTLSQSLFYPTAGLVGFWELDEAAGTIAYGTAGTAINGTIVGTASTNWTRVGCGPWVTGVDDQPAVEFALRSVSPNPMRERANFGFALPQSAQVRLEILDLQGRRVATVADGMFAAGTHQVTWNGASGGGSRISAGVYFVRFSAAGRTVSKRLVIVH
jgi:hypothetical protein